MTNTRVFTLIVVATSVCIVVASETIVLAETCFDDPCLPLGYFHGLDFGPYEDEQQPGDYIPPEQIQARLEIIAPYTHWVRSYGASLGLERIPDLAKGLGLNVAMGTWIVDYGNGERDAEIGRLVEAAKAGWVDIAVIGNEEIFSGRETDHSLATLIKYVQDRLDDNGVGHIPVTTPEPFDTLFAPDGTPRSPEVLEAVDVVSVNIYPFHRGIHISNAGQTLTDLYNQGNQIVHDWIDPDKDVLISETGWPSEGETRGQAVPSCENAACYLQDSIFWADANSVPLFYFEAFDENWKGPEEFETHWGVWYNDGSLKLPEPATLLLLILGGCTTLLRRHKRSRG